MLNGIVYHLSKIITIKIIDLPLCCDKQDILQDAFSLKKHAVIRGCQAQESHNKSSSCDLQSLLKPYNGFV